MYIYNSDKQQVQSVQLQIQYSTYSIRIMAIMKKTVSEYCE